MVREAVRSWLPGPREVREPRNEVDSAMKKTTTAHTPGPWIARMKSSTPHVVSIFQDAQDRRCTAFVAICDSTTLPNAANATLIAAAPDLLDAAIAIRETCPCDNDITQAFNAAWHQMLAAIAKAEGQ